MGDLMRDPVVLPSRHVVDRSTIVQHLLSDPKDPFTRQPMTIEDAVPATELRERIEQADYLYVSHLHNDHWDAPWLREHLRRDIGVLLPGYPTRESRKPNAIAAAVEEAAENAATATPSRTS